MSLELKGRVICVTGGGRGIGRAIAERLKQASATVIVADVDLPEDAARFSDLALKLDVTREDSWAAAEQEIRARFGTLSGLVNNAGIFYTGPIEDMPLDAWRRLLAVNVDGVMLGLRTMLPLLRDAAPALPGGATIVNMSSVAGLRGSAFNIAYTTSKGAVTLMSRSAAVEFATLGYGIRVNSVHPGGIQTDMIDGIYDRYVELGQVASREEAASAARTRYPLGRLGAPAEIAEAVAFLSSEASSFMTGTQMVVDGGYTAS
jgi:NAD(P)-dependent dehydrogenase (short-subunit alcohol dehydrogenase family)